MNIFNTPVLSYFFHWLARFCMWAKGWKVVGSPPDIPHYVLIAAPHTTNWDFPAMLGMAFSRRMQVKWMGKHTLFSPVLGVISRWFGGVSVNRNDAKDIVEQMADEFSQREQFTLIIPVEGTRSKVTKWKTGFYRIAVQAGVPIVPAYVDYPNKTGGFGETFYPTGDQEADIAQLQEFYKNFRGHGVHAQ
jgi:1-acyl-sn-glycerol-3-phosphate acyltransferase